MITILLEPSQAQKLDDMFSVHCLKGMRMRMRVNESKLAESNVFCFACAHKSYNNFND